LHPSDTLVVGPLHLLGHSLRLPLGTVLAGLLALLLVGVGTALVAVWPLPAPLGALPGPTAGFTRRLHVNVVSRSAQNLLSHSACSPSHSACSAGD
jgi:hypothetical protein